MSFLQCAVATIGLSMKSSFLHVWNSIGVFIVFQLGWLCILDPTGDTSPNQDQRFHIRLAATSSGPTSLVTIRNKHNTTTLYNRNKRINATLLGLSSSTIFDACKMKLVFSCNPRTCFTTKMFIKWFYSCDSSQEDELNILVPLVSPVHAADIIFGLGDRNRKETQRNHASKSKTTSTNVLDGVLDIVTRSKSKPFWI